MPETALAATSNTTNPELTANSNGGTPEASDAANGNSFANTGRQVLVVDNVGASSRTVTIRDKNGNNTGVVTVAANKMQVIGPFPVDVYGETVKFTSSHAELECRVFNIAAGLKNTITGK